MSNTKFPKNSLTPWLIALFSAFLANEGLANSYSLIQGDFTWHEAQANAESLGGHLATITSEEEWNTILSDLGGSLESKNIWLGGSDEGIEGVWEWVTGEPWDFTRWSLGTGNGGVDQPDNGNAFIDQNHLILGQSYNLHWDDVQYDHDVPYYLLEVENASVSESAFISFPQSEAHLGGRIDVLGSITTSGSFGGGVLEIVPAGQSARFLKSFTSPVNEGVLFQGWDTTSYEDGFYVLKLSVFDANGNLSFSEVSFFIDNTPPLRSVPLRINHMLYGIYVLPKEVSVGVYGEFNESIKITGARWVASNGSTLASVDLNGVQLPDREVNAFLPLPNTSQSQVSLEIQVEDQAGNLSEWITSNQVELSDEAPSPFTRPSYEAMLLPNERQAIEFQGLLWDGREALDRVEWRQVVDGSSWQTVSQLDPNWFGWTWKFDWPVRSVLSAEVEVRAIDRYDNVFGPVATKIQMASHPFLDLQFPLCELMEPSGILYQGEESIPIIGTVLNRPGQSDFSWRLEVARGDNTNWTVLIEDQADTKENSILAQWAVPNESGVYRLRLRAFNIYGEAVTTLSVYVSEEGSPDSDEDGLSDILEYELFGGLGESTESDYDGDGMSNGEEIQYGFDPVDGRSRLEAIGRVEQGWLRLSWIHRGSIGYEVYRRERLETGQWERVGELEVSGNLVEQYEVALDEGKKSMYYRVVEKNEFKLLELGNGVELEMVGIPSGTFMMGSPEEEKDRWTGERPLTQVTISRPFWLGKYEVTQGQWEAVMGNNPSRLSGDDRLPVRWVSWDEAVAFCEELNQRFGQQLSSGYRFGLPTDAQWEYACRAGTTTRFSYGDDLNYNELSDYGWYSGNGLSSAHPVGEKLPNPWGLYDMHGNVWEWCSDWYGSYPGGSVTDPVGPNSGSYRVLRGGGWNDSRRLLRSASRAGDFPTYGNDDFGFRVALQFSP